MGRRWVAWEREGSEEKQNKEGCGKVKKRMREDLYGRSIKVVECLKGATEDTMGWHAEERKLCLGKTKGRQNKLLFRWTVMTR